MREPDTRVPWRWVLSAWSVPVVLSAFATYANATEAARPISLLRAIWLGLGAWVAWPLLTPIIVRLSQRWPLDRRIRPRFVIGHLAAALAVGVIATALTAVTAYAPSAETTFGMHVRSRIAIRAPMAATLYFIILGVSYLAINTRRLRERELFAERLSRALSEAQLGALRMQLHPHFLFNSLNAVMALVRDEATDRADRALTLLSDVLRTTLREGTRPHIALKDEVAFLRNYLEIEMLRFGENLRVTYAISDEVADAPVPTFVLQPLVENALQHGILHLPDGGTLHIGAERRCETLVLDVVDDGVGLAADWESRAQRGVGITNLRARLAHMYDAAGRVTITPRAGRVGTHARVELPYEAGA